MAFYIAIRRVAEDDERAIYQYSRDEMGPDAAAPPRRRQRQKVVRTLVATCAICKRTGEVTHVEHNGWALDSAEFSRVARKLYLHWRDGPLPAETCWAS